MKYLRDMTFAKGLILVCLVGSAYLGWKAWKGHQAIQTLEVALAQGGQVERMVREIQQESDEYTDLYRLRKGEELQAQTDPIVYIRSIASSKNIELGFTDIAPRTVPVGRDFVDRQYTITPKDRAATFDLIQIANFLYTLEARSHRVRVTRLKINTPDRVLPHEYPPENTWMFDCTITSRGKRED